MAQYTTPIVFKHKSRFNHILTSSSPRIKETLSDRFIPVRLHNNPSEMFIDETPHELEDNKSDNDKFYEALLTENLEISSNENSKICKKLSFDDSEPTVIIRKNSGKILNFRTEYTRVQSQYDNSPIKYLTNKQFKAGIIRKLPKAPLQILDSPGLKDDPYTNILDWSDKDIICVAIKNKIYSLKEMGTIPSILIDFPKDFEITSIAFNNSGELMAIGSNSGKGFLIDIMKKGVIGTFESKLRQTSITWRDNNHLTVGSLDGVIIDYDVRIKQNIVRVIESKIPLINIKWSINGNMMCGSSSDGKVLLWDAREKATLYKFPSHSGFVKGLSWSISNLLATGSSDGIIKIWDSNDFKCLKEIDTVEVYSLIFSRNTNEFVSGHGGSLNSATIWNIDGHKIGNLLGHQMKVSHLALNPTGDQLLTGSIDETLRFWKVFPSNKVITAEDKSLIGLSCMEIR